DIARIFRVPPHMLADLTKSSFANMEQQGLEFVNHTIIPWVERIEESIESTFIFDDENLSVEFEFSNLLRADTKSRAEYSQAMVYSGIMSVNEARMREGLNPLPGTEFETPRQPMNMGNAGVGKVEKSVSDIKGSAQNVAYQSTEMPQEIESFEQETPVSDSIDDTQHVHAARLNAIAVKVAERVARKEFMAISNFLKSGKDFYEAIDATYKSHPRYVSESMAIDTEESEKYCSMMREYLLGGGQASVKWMEEQSMSLLSEFGGFRL
ncbi:MAG: phage portal protein, partial [Magnetococcales bacterium]|nr:phage portal protein [Magnetococcales bacterium]